MTLVVGLVCRLPKKGTPAVIVAGDRQFASPGDECAHRISILPDSCTVAAFAGPRTLGGRLIDTLAELFPQQGPDEGLPLSCGEFDMLVRRRVEPSVKRLVRTHEEAVKDSGFGLILASSDDQEVRLYAVRSDGVPFRVDRGPGYGCVGREYATPGVLRFSQFRTEHLPPKRAGRLVAFMILAVSMVDSRVGREPEIFQTVGGLAKRWDDDALQLARERIHTWDESLDRYRGWLGQGDADFGASSLESIMRRRQVGLTSGESGGGAGAESPMSYPQQPT